jgi:hypothetical protein
MELPLISRLKRARNIAAGACPAHCVGTKRSSKRLDLESLEARQLLAANPIINEFMADNASSLADGDGRFSDWIEIYNAGDAPADMTGWHLTDDGADLTKWTFPSVTIAPHGFFVVFASKPETPEGDPIADYIDAGGNYHANFSLSKEGEYLGLVAPDGVTVASDFGPSYPEQQEDRAFGLGMSRQDTNLAAVGGSSKTLIPTAATGLALGDSWKQAAFDDSGAGWKSGPTPVGYDVVSGGTPDSSLLGFWNFESSYADASSAARTGVPRGNVAFSSDAPAVAGNTRALTLDGAGDYVDLPLGAANPFSGAQDFTVAAWFKTSATDNSILLSSARDATSTNHSMAWFLKSTATCCDALTGLYVDNYYVNQVGVGQNQSPAINVMNGAWRYGAMTFSAATSTYTMYVYDGAGFKSLSRAFAPAIPNVAADTVRIGGTLNGTYPAGGDFTGGIDDLAIYGRVLSAGELDSLRTGNYAAVGIVSQSYDATIATDVETEMHNSNASAYIRVPMNIATASDLESIDALKLRMQYDDGFVAYLNGVEIARRNAPGSVGAAPAYNAAATADRSKTQGLTVEEIDVSAFASALQVGDNMLAIHALNVSAADGDFLLAPQLVATKIITSLDVGVLDAPTPRSANSLVTSLAPTIDTPGRTFTGSLSVTITPGIAGDQIYYTLDGTTPTAASTLYAGPISLTASRQLRAIGIRPGRSPSPIVGESYVRLAADAAGFSSNLPIVVLDGYNTPSIPSTGYGSYSLLTFDTSTETGRSALASTASNVSRTGIRIRGASSAGADKQQFRLETHDQSGDDLDLSLFGMPSDSDWVLGGEANWEKSLIRNSLMFDLGRDAGLLAPRYRPVEVFMNRDGDDLEASDYVGVYLMMEDIKISDDRVDIPELDASDTGEPDITGGYIIHFEGSAVDGTQTLAGWNSLELEDASSYTVAQRAYISNYVNEFDNVLSGPDFADPANGYAKYIDVDSFVNTMIIAELGRDQDAYVRSNYLYKDRGGKLVEGPLWDKDLTLGVGCCFDNRNTAGWQYQQNYNRGLEQNGGDNPDWFVKLMADPNFAIKFRDRWFELRQSSFSDAALDALVDAQTTIVQEAAARNFARWPVLNVGQAFAGPNTATWPEQITALKSWLHARTAWIDSQLLVPAAPTLPLGGAKLPGDTITVTSPIVTNAVDTSVFALGSPIKFSVPTNDALGDAWTATSFVDSAWTAGTSGLGYDNSTAAPAVDYRALFGTQGQVRPTTYPNAPTGAIVCGACNTILMRGAFTVADLSAVDQVKLRVKYDDGFIAYINGQEVARRNFAGPASYNSAASDHVDSAAFVFEDIVFTPAAGLLNAGANNVLAIRAINSGTGSSDMLLAPELVLVDQQPVAAAPTYVTTDGSDPRGANGLPAVGLYDGAPIPLSDTTRVQARTFVNGQWSTLASQLYTLPNPLRITELMYQPREAAGQETHGNRDDYEFIELQNTSTTQTLDLTDYQLAGGVELVFSSVTLAPGERTVVVNNAGAFLERYGVEIPAQREYSGNLSNAGESLTLLDAAGGVIESFTFDDAWYPETDGGGYSLVVANPADLLADLNTAAAWKASLQIDGSPGAGDAIPGDINLDAKVDLNDLAILQAHLGIASGALWTDGDLTGDGAVNRADAAILASHFGAGAAMALSPAAPAAILATVQRAPTRAAASPSAPPALAARRDRPTAISTDTSASAATLRGVRGPRTQATPINTTPSAVDSAIAELNLAPRRRSLS